jgi:hypothetical protein
MPVRTRSKLVGEASYDTSSGPSRAVHQRSLDRGLQRAEQFSCGPRLAPSLSTLLFTSWSVDLSNCWALPLAAEGSAEVHRPSGGG